MRNRLDLMGKVVVITGGGRGIGAATAREFVSRGARVALGDIDVPLAKATADEIGCGTTGLHLDVTDRDSIDTFLDEVERTVGPVDVMVNNAGIMPVVAFDEESRESIRRQLDINIGGVLHGSQEAVRRFGARGVAGHVVNIASAAGKLAFPGVATYNATKFAVVGLTQALAAEFYSTGITFTVVLPAIVRTELAAGLGEHWALRTSDPEQVARAIVKATETRRFEVAVPRELKFLYRAHDLLPHRVGAFALRSLGGDSFIMSGAGNADRAAYEARAAGTD